MKDWKTNIITIFLLAGSLSLFTACNASDDNSDDETALLALLSLGEQQRKAAVEAAKQCETTVDNNSTFDIATPLELCKPIAGNGRHFRFESVSATSNNHYLNLLVGYGARSDSTNFPTSTSGFGTGATTNEGDGRWRVFFGKSISCNKSLIQPNFSGTNSGSTSYHELFTMSAINSVPGTPGCTGGNSEVWGPSTICMDITKGSTGSSPRITVWATGKNGADCSKLSTLTDSSKIYEKKDWTSQVETRDDKNYLYRNADSISTTKVVVRSETAIQD